MLSVGRAGGLTQRELEELLRLQELNAQTLQLDQLNAQDLQQLQKDLHELDEYVSQASKNPEAAALAEAKLTQFSRDLARMLSAQQASGDGDAERLFAGSCTGTMPEQPVAPTTVGAVAPRNAQPPPQPMVAVHVLANDPHATASDRQEALRYLVSGGTAVPADVANRLINGEINDGASVLTLLRPNMHPTAFALASSQSPPMASLNASQAVDQLVAPRTPAEFAALQAGSQVPHVPSSQEIQAMAAFQAAGAMGEGGFNPLRANTAGGMAAGATSMMAASDQAILAFAAGGAGMCFEDKVALIMSQFIKDMQKQIEQRLEKLRASAASAGGDGGGSGAIESRNIEFEILKTDMQKLSQIQQAFSNVLNEMHNLAMSSIRQIGK